MHAQQHTDTAIRPNGWLAIDKPIGMTSAKVVHVVKRLTRAKKVGHAGTLDPMATGVLPIALGEATKTMQFVTNSQKEYVFEVLFGAATDTDDAEGEVVGTCEVIPSAKEVAKVLPEFIGTIEQIPPVYSAIKVGGKRSYALARAGEAKTLAPRKVTIDALELVEQTAENRFRFRVACGKGTYVRALARDIAEKLGTKGHVTALRRTITGNFLEKDTISLEKLEELVHNAPLFEIVLPVSAALDDIPVVELTPANREYVRHGQAVPLPRSNTALQQGAVVCGMCHDTLIAIGTVEAHMFKPVRVLNV